MLKVRVFAFLYGLKPIFKVAETDILGWQNLQKKAEKAESKTSEISML